MLPTQDKRFATVLYGHAPTNRYYLPFPHIIIKITPFLIIIIITITYHSQAKHRLYTTAQLVFPTITPSTTTATAPSATHHSPLLASATVFYS